MSDDKHEVEVRVKSLKTGETIKFKVPETTTLQTVWDTGLTKLNETRTAGDIFRCASGEDLTGLLNQTLADVQKEKVCPNHHFEIKGPSGGAIA